MLIECLRRREGGSRTTFRGRNYVFLPREDGRHVCEITNRDHISAYLAIPAYKVAPELNEVDHQGTEDDDDIVLNPEDIVSPDRTPAQASDPYEAEGDVDDVDGEIGDDDIGPEPVISDEGEIADEDDDIEDDEGDIGDDEPEEGSIETMTEAQLIDAHAAVFGKPPHPNMKPENLRQKLIDARDSK